MFKPSFLLLILVTLNSCGFLRANGLFKEKSTPNSSDDSLVSIIKPKDSAKVDGVQLGSHFGGLDVFFKVNSGMFAFYSRKDFLKLGSVTCPSTGELSQVILKVDGDYAYVYRNESIQGGSDYVSVNGVLTLKCNASETLTTTKVEKVKYPKQFTDLVAQMQSMTPAGTTTYYDISGNLQVIRDVSQDDMTGETSSIYDAPNRFSMFYGLSSSEFTIVHANSFTQTEKTKRENLGDSYPLETLRNELKRIALCSTNETTHEETCLSGQDLSYLL